MLTSSTIKQKVDSLWDKFWSGGISNPLVDIVTRNSFRENKTK